MFLQKIFNFVLSFQNKFLKYGYLVIFYMYLRYCKTISRSCTLNLYKGRDFENRPQFPKRKNHNSKVSDRNELNFEVYVFIIGGICVLKINNLADKL